MFFQVCAQWRHSYEILSRSNTFIYVLNNSQQALQRKRTTREKNLIESRFRTHIFLFWSRPRLWRLFTLYSRWPENSPERSQKQQTGAVVIVVASGSDDDAAAVTANKKLFKQIVCCVFVLFPSFLCARYDFHPPPPAITSLHKSVYKLIFILSTRSTIQARTHTHTIRIPISAAERNYISFFVAVVVVYCVFDEAQCWHVIK